MFFRKVKVKVLTVLIYDSKKMKKMHASSQPVLQIHWILQCQYALLFELKRRV